MPGWIWLLMGLGVTAILAGGVFWFTYNSRPVREELTPEQKAEIEKHILDDLPERDAIDIDKATNPTDLPEKTQKKYDQSVLSEAHESEMQKAFGPLPKGGPDGDLVDTTATPTWADDFSDPATGWKVSTDDKAIRQYKDGALQLTLKKGHGSAQIMAGRPAKDFSLHIEVTPPQNVSNLAYGIVARQSDASHFTAFLLTTSGDYSVIRFVKGNKTIITQGKVSPNIKPGEGTLRLDVSCVENYYSFTVNKEIVGVGEIKDWEAQGDFGVIAVRSQDGKVEPARVSFDNIAVWRR